MNTAKVLSYNNDINLKNLVVSEMIKHKEQDSFIKGAYCCHVNGRFYGCAVGCAIESLNRVLGKDYNTDTHSSLQESIGIPPWLSKVQDDFFECLPGEYGSKFAIEFLESIPIGVDLEPVRCKLNMLLLKEGIEIIQDKENLLQEVKDEALDALRNSLFLYETSIKSNAWNVELSNKQIKKLERLALKASIHFPKNISHIVNMSLKSIKVDENSMHKMFFSAIMGSGGEKPSSEHIRNAYIEHSYQLLNLLKNSGVN
jgi:hypothetical protein